MALCLPFSCRKKNPLQCTLRVHGECRIPMCVSFVRAGALNTDVLEWCNYIHGFYLVHSVASNGEWLQCSSFDFRLHVASHCQHPISHTRIHRFFFSSLMRWVLFPFLVPSWFFPFVPLSVPHVILRTLCITRLHVVIPSLFQLQTALISFRFITTDRFCFRFLSLVVVPLALI